MSPSGACLGLFTALGAKFEATALVELPLALQGLLDRYSFSSSKKGMELKNPMIRSKVMAPGI